MERFKLLREYTNGNYQVRLLEDGTKIRYTDGDEFFPEFPESIDLKITNRCDRGCLMCHEKSTKDGKHASLHHPFLTSLQAGTELAIGGGNPLEHPDLIPFLQRMKEKGIVCNMTVHQVHLIENLSFVQNLLDEKLIYGLGISVASVMCSDAIAAFCQKNKNAVLHVIAGIVSTEMLEKFYDKDLKLLILGYKRVGRGIDYYSTEIENGIAFLEENILDIAKHFKVVSFDNLAIGQLKMQSKVDDFDLLYMGDDGDFTMYVDLVKNEFAVSSTCEKRFPIKESIIEMFKAVREEKRARA